MGTESVHILGDGGKRELNLHFQHNEKSIDNA